MKKSNAILILMMIMTFCLTVTGCGKSKNVQTANSDQNKSDCRFAFGDDVSARFTGTVYRNNLIASDDVYHFPETNVITFAPNSRSHWHVHGGMTVIGVGGVGLCQEYGKPAIIIRKGDVIQIPAGTPHWHGSVKDSWFQQIVVYDKQWQPAEGQSISGSEITDEEFAGLTMIEHPNRIAKPDAALTFARSQMPVKLPTFSGDVYVSDVTTADNAAVAPGMHYVVFPNGVYNAWHSHNGGQILIVTDGVGYHQVKGGEVEVLHVGDVAFCPPGETHWHGGSIYGTFAHIAINTNPDNPGVTWYDMMSEDEYKALSSGK